MAKIYVSLREWENAMKSIFKRYTYLFGLLAAGVFCAMIYFGGYFYAVNYLDSDNLVTKDEAASRTPGINVANTSENEPEIVMQNAQYTEEIYNSDTDAFTKENLTLPVEYIGLTRDEIIDYLTRFMNENEDKTLLNIQLVSFSQNSIVIRKTTCNPKNVYNYFAVSEDNIIKIYTADKEKLYIDTGINVSNLEEAYKEELKTGFYVETIHDLYNYLESVTS